MTTAAKITTLLHAIERRLTDISAQQHALAVEKAPLLEQLTPLRLGGGGARHGRGPARPRESRSRD